ncbi:winged helix-turn-helix domain-containing protein [Phormidium tenue FACHB-886]|nr:winged helix-turn-helix domain-containing protein [Phormidium tenue FACHB-886]
MCHDRSRIEPLPLTHGALAHLLGVRRASVSEVVSALQKAGLIESQRGRIQQFSVW